MWGWGRSRLLKVVVVVLLLLGVSWLALDFFIPAPPSKITMATGPRGTGLDYFGRRYREAFARAGVELDLRQTSGTMENFTLVNDRNSGVQIAIVNGGVAENAQVSGLLSLGVIYTPPVWLFYSSAEPIDGLPQLKGKRIAVGPEGSGVRFTAERILARANVNSRTATLLPLAGRGAADALLDGKADAAFIISPAAAPAIRELLKVPHIRLMDLSAAEALTRIFPDLVRLNLPKGMIDLDPMTPASDTTLLGNLTKLVIRDDVHPAIVQLLAKTAKEVHDKPGFFQRAGEFPMAVDSEFPLSQIAVDYYKKGPSFLEQYLPFWMIIYARRAIAFLIAAVAIIIPLFSLAPRLYGWFVQERLRKLYRRLRVVEKALQAQLTKKQILALQNEIADIDRATDAISTRNSDLYFMLRYHLDRTRSRLGEMSALQN